MREPHNPETPAKTIKMEPRWVFVQGALPPEANMRICLHHLLVISWNYKLFFWLWLLGEWDQGEGGGWGRWLVVLQLFWLLQIEMFINQMLESRDFVWSCVCHKYSYIKPCHSSILQQRMQDLAAIEARCNFWMAAFRSGFFGQHIWATFGVLFVPSKKQER